MASDQTKLPSSWSSDGRFLLFTNYNSSTGADLWVVPMVGDRTPSLVLQTPFRERYGEFSPEGRWVAYESNESMREEVYVRPFVPPTPEASTFASATADKSADKAAGLPGASTATATAGGQWQVSTAGGIHPAWRRDGKELYYLNPAGAMMAVPIAVAGGGLEPGAPVVLFPTHIVGGGVDGGTGRQYDVAADGRFLINTEIPVDAAPITLIQNWTPEAKK